MSSIQPNHQQEEQLLPPHSSDPDQELPRVLLALQTVYSNNNNNNNNNNNDNNPFHRRDVADKYLTSFQRTPVAWIVCDRLLSSSHSDEHQHQMDSSQSTMLRTQRQFFAAQTLHAKCLTDVYQLPTESLPSLRDSLITHFILSLPINCIDRSGSVVAVLFSPILSIRPNLLMGI